MFELKIIRERKAGYGAPSAMRSSSDIYSTFRERFERADREEFLVLLLDAKNKLLGFHVVSVGSLTSSIVHPREVFKAAILGNAAAIILLHNHPSGDPALLHAPGSRGAPRQCTTLAGFPRRGRLLHTTCDDAGVR